MSKARKQFGSAEHIETSIYDAIGCADLDSMTWWWGLWADEEKIIYIPTRMVRA